MTAKLEAREPVARYLATPPLLQHFDRVAQPPGGVARLRELILTLAVQGKLVPQDPADEPASVLLERIRAEKARLVKEGKIRKEKPLVAIAEKEKPFALPSGWEWVRLGAVAKKITDGTHHSPLNTASGEFKYISAKNIKPCLCLPFRNNPVSSPASPNCAPSAPNSASASPPLPRPSPGWPRRYWSRPSRERMGDVGERYVSTGLWH